MFGRKKSEGRPLPDTADMKAWREEFKEMSLEDHDRVLKNLGLDDEDIKEFNEAEKSGRKLEDVMGLSQDGTEGQANTQEGNGKKGKK